MSMSSVGQVLSCSQEAIVVIIEDLKKFEEHKPALQVGRYLRIAQGNNDFTVAIIRNIRGVIGQGEDTKPKWQFHIECQAVGTLVDNTTFEPGSVLLPVPTEPAFPADQDTLDKLFTENSDYQFPLGQLSLNKATAIKLHGDRFFSKHIAIVGSTGSGKSCAVARILHDVVGITDGKNSSINTQKNSALLT